jgi:hypothetical protein
MNVMQEVIPGSEDFGVGSKLVKEETFFFRCVACKADSERQLSRVNQ